MVHACLRLGIERLQYNDAFLLWRGPLLEGVVLEQNLQEPRIRLPKLTHVRADITHVFILQLSRTVNIQHLIVTSLRSSSRALASRSVCRRRACCSSPTGTSSCSFQIKILPSSVNQRCMVENEVEFKRTLKNKFSQKNSIKPVQSFKRRGMHS
jgi:hypothetical protein